MTPSNQHCFQPTVHLLGSCLSVYLAHWSRIYHFGQMRIKKVSGYSVCGIYVNFIAWSDDFNKAKRSKDLTLWDLCHALCTSCTTYIDGWNFRQKKAHTYVHKKGLFTQKSFSTNLRFLKLCMIEEENKRKVHNLARNSKLSIAVYYSEQVLFHHQTTLPQLCTVYDLKKYQCIVIIHSAVFWWI